MQIIPELAQTGEDGLTCEIGLVLGVIASELEISAKRCAEIQWVISELLGRAQHSDIPKELLVLQDIDRIQQTLEDVSRLLEASTHPLKGVVTTQESLSKHVKLDSLRTRLFPPSAGTDNHLASDQRLLKTMTRLPGFNLFFKPAPPIVARGFSDHTASRPTIPGALG